MLLQSVHQDGLRHLQSAVQIDKILVLIGELLFGYRLERTIEVVDGVEKIFGESLEGELARS